jgi:hypothetical protein
MEQPSLTRFVNIGDADYSIFSNIPSENFDGSAAMVPIGFGALMEESQCS